MGHAIGFFHEQSRPDRDRFVDIVEENILAPNLFNFDKLPRSRIDSKAVPYDLRSVMHYGARVSNRKVNSWRVIASLWRTDLIVD